MRFDTLPAYPDPGPVEPPDPGPDFRRAILIALAVALGVFLAEASVFFFHLLSPLGPGDVRNP